MERVIDKAARVQSNSIEFGRLSRSTIGPEEKAREPAHLPGDSHVRQSDALSHVPFDHL